MLKNFLFTRLSSRPSFLYNSLSFFFKSKTITTISNFSFIFIVVFENFFLNNLLRKLIPENIRISLFNYLNVFSVFEIVQTIFTVFLYLFL